MGIKYAHAYTYVIKELTIEQICLLARKALKNNVDNNTAPPRLPRIDVDVSWIIRGFASGDVDCRIKYLLKLSTAFINGGFEVNLVCDGKKRHHSKRATIKRNSDCQRKRLDLIIGKSQLMILSGRRQSTDSIEERNDIQKTLNLLQTKLKGLENAIQQSSFEFGENFFEKLTEAIANNANNKNITANLALFQADSVMASNMIHNTSEILLTCDSDQAALIGEKCVCIKNFKLVEEKKKYKVEKIDIFCASKSTKIFIQQALNLPDYSNKIVDAKYPLFDDVPCPRLRAIIAVGLGCDVNLTPVVTPAMLLEFLQSSLVTEVASKDAYFAVKKYYINSWLKNKRKNPSMTAKYDITSEIEVEQTKFVEMIDVFVDTFMYEPTNVETYDDNMKLTYIHHEPPNQLHQYIQDFDYKQTKSTEVVDCCVVVDLPVCSGNGGDCHPFMRAEGHCFCSNCKKITCLQCTFQKSKGEKYYCYDCYLPSLSIDPHQLENQLSITEIREELRDMGIETNATDEMCSLVELYKEAKCNEVYSESTIKDNIKTPIATPDYLPVLEQTTISKFLI